MEKKKEEKISGHKLMASLAIFYITVPNQKVGEQIAQNLLNKKLIACANILPPHKSLYTWKEKICNENENILILKSKHSLQKQIEVEVKKIHPHECPCILTFSPSYGNKEFIDWIESQTLNLQEG